MPSLPSSLALANDRVSLSFQIPSEEAPACRVELRDKLTGLVLEGGLCELDVLWSPIQRIETHKDLVVARAEKLSETRAIFTFLAKWSRIEFDLDVTLEGGEFVATVPWKSLREGCRDFFRACGVRPFPGLLRAGKEGTILAPVRSGALIFPGRHRLPLKDQFLIYGQQWRWEDLPLLPICAAYEEGKRGVAVIAERGDHDAQFEIGLDGEGNGTVGFSCRYRYHWPDPVDGIDRTLRYCLLDRTSADYSGIGRRLNRFVRETWRMSTLAEKCARSPEVAYSASAMTMKTFHAQKDLQHEKGDGTYRVFQTFAETGRQLRKLKAAGLEKVAIQLVGWNLDGHDGRYPERFPVDPRLGGEKDFRELVRLGKQLGYQMQVHDNYSDSHLPDHKAVLRMLWGDPLPRGIWGGGAIYATNPCKLTEEEARRDMLKLRDLVVAGLYYLDAMSPPLEVDYDPKGGGPRRHHADGLAWILEQGRQVFGACGTECAFAHIVRHSDYIGDVALRNVYAGLKSATPIQSVVDDWVPLWHLAFHGMLVHCAADQPFPSAAKVLEAAETGASPRSDFSGENPEPGGSLFAIQWDDRLLPAYKAKCDILLGLLGDTKAAFLEKHRRLGEQQFESAFSNGRVVTVDYAAKRLVVDGKEVAIPPVFDLDVPHRKGPNA